MKQGALLLLASGLLFHPRLLAQQHELGFTLGRVLSTDRGSPQGSIAIDGGTALQANYAYRLIGGSKAALYGEVHFLANPLREIGSPARTATRDVATLFVTPGVRVKFLPNALVSPYVAIGGGYALFEHSLNRLDGQPNQAPRTISRGVFDYGGGFDVKVWRFVSARGEIRDFFAGSPAYNIPGVRGGQHNVVVSGGFVIRIHSAR